MQNKNKYWEKNNSSLFGVIIIVYKVRKIKDIKQVRSFTVFDLSNTGWISSGLCRWGEEPGDQVRAGDLRKKKKINSNSHSKLLQCFPAGLLKRRPRWLFSPWKWAQDALLCFSLAKTIVMTRGRECSGSDMMGRTDREHAWECSLLVERRRAAPSTEVAEDTCKLWNRVRHMET